MYDCMPMRNALPAHPYAGARACYPQACWMDGWLWLMLAEGAGRPCPRLTNASPHAPFSCARLSHRRDPHTRAPSSPIQDANPPAAPMRHQSDLRSYGAGGRAAHREMEKGAACLAMAERATRESPPPSATYAPESAPRAKRLVEHVGASARGVQHSVEHCVAA